MANESLEHVLRKVRKLLGLARGGATEAEAEEAVRIAHGLLARHNLTLDDALRGASDERVIDSDTVDGSRECWPIYVWNGVARLYFCEYYYTRMLAPAPPRAQIGLRHTFVGRRYNVRVAKLMGEYLVVTVNRIAREHGRRVEPDERLRFRRSFKAGCAGRLAERLWQRRLETQRRESAGPEGSTLPALASLYDVEATANRELLKRHGVELGEAEAPDRINHAGGAEAGVKAADGISLEPQINSTCEGASYSQGEDQLPLF